MDIYLEAFDKQGTTILEIGGYHSPTVPRIGEKITLRLTPLPEPNYPATLLFVVTDVFYSADNTMPTEEWQHPYPFGSQSISVTIRVEPATTAEGKASQDYINRIAAGRRE